jgi:hypothetical protein
MSPERVPPHNKEVPQSRRISTGNKTGESKPRLGRENSSTTSPTKRMISPFQATPPCPIRLKSHPPLFEKKDPLLESDVSVMYLDGVYGLIPKARSRKWRGNKSSGRGSLREEWLMALVRLHAQWCSFSSARGIDFFLAYLSSFGSTSCTQKSTHFCSYVH